MDEPIRIFTGKIEERKKNVYIKEKLVHNCSTVYYYDNPDDMKSVTEGGLNLPPGHRPWPSFKKTTITDNKEIVEIKRGREAFNDPILYRPVLMKEYIEKYFITPFEKIGRKSPFMFQPNEILQDQKISREQGEDVIQVKAPHSNFSLNPQQKFCGQFISYDTDFPGLLVNHGIGSGKTITAVEMAMSFVNKRRIGETFVDIPERKVNVKNNQEVGSSVVFVIPKNLRDDYIEELLGSIKKSATGMCVIYCQEDNVESSDYNKYRQFYHGSSHVNSSGIIEEYDNPLLNQLKKCETEIENFKSKFDRNTHFMESDDYNSEEKQKFAKENVDFTKKIKALEVRIKDINNNINKNISDVFFLVTHETFVNRLQKEIVHNNKKVYTASDFVLGENPQFVKGKSSTNSYFGTTAIHPDCLHSNKTLFIIDEIQKTTGSSDPSLDKSMRYNALYNTLFIHCRSYVDGTPTVKLVLLTATPVYDNPYQMSTMVNIIRPRLMFPRKMVDYNDYFIDKERNVMKNKLLHSYMISGYISYFKGGNPEKYPYRKNKIVLHKMGSYQLRDYENNLRIDIDLMKKSKTSLRDDSHLNDFAERHSTQIYRNSINTCLCAFPENLVKDNNPYMFNKEFNKIFKENKFGEYSSKLKNIGDDLYGHKGGPVFVYSDLIRRGLYPLICYLWFLGFEFIGFNNNHNKSAKQLSEERDKNGNPKKRFTIWSPILYTDFFLKQGLIKDDHDSFKKRTKDLLNDPLNRDGSVCQVIIGNITEGVTFLRISKIILLKPWWNDSRVEQIVGRGIRFMSHSDLPESLQYVEVEYHCTVLPSYPKRNDNLNEILGYKNKVMCAHCKLKREESKTVAKKTKKTSTVSEPKKKPMTQKKEESFKTGNRYIDLLIDDSDSEEFIEENNDEKCTCEMLRSENRQNDLLSEISVEQKIFIVSRLKNNINKEFEMNLKESAVDYELNKNGNISRLEEYEYPDLVNKGFKLFYDRPTNNYYIYENEILYRALLNKNVKSVWPPVEYEKLEPYHDQSIIKRKVMNDKGTEMIYINIMEEIHSFINDPRTNNMNFLELKQYAIEHGEEKRVWDEVEKYGHQNDLIAVLFKYNRNINPDLITRNMDFRYIKSLIGKKE